MFIIGDKDECSALGQGHFPIEVPEGVQGQELARKGEPLGDNCIVYASVNRFATDKEAKAILRNIDPALISRSIAPYEKGYTQLIYGINIFSDLRQYPLDGMLTSHWKKMWPRHMQRAHSRGNGQMFKLYITNRTSCNHRQFTKKKPAGRNCICFECRTGAANSVQPFKGRITAFQEDINNKTGYVLFEFIGNEDNVLVKNAGSRKLSTEGKKRAREIASRSKPNVGAAKLNAQTILLNRPLSELVSRRQVSDTCDPST